MSFWRKDDPIFSPTGSVIVGGMFHYQRDWWDRENFVKVLLGGYGSGKTVCLAKRGIAAALHNAPAPSMFISPSYPLAKQTIIRTIRTLLNGKRALLAGFDFVELRQFPWTFEISYGPKQATILIYSGKDPDQLKGPNIGWAGIDEPFIQDEKVLDQALARVRDPAAKRHEIAMAGTPEGLNWGADIIEGSRRDQFDLACVRASTRENKALSPAYVKRLLAAYSEADAAGYVDGFIVNTTKNATAHAYRKENNVVDAVMPPGARLFAGMDFNVNPLAFCVGWVHGKRAHYIADYELNNSDTSDAARTLRADFPTLVDVYPDSNSGRSTNSPGGKTDYDFLTAAGFRVHRYPGGNPPVRDRVNTTNGMLRNALGEVRLTVSPKCESIIRTLSTLNGERATRHLQHMFDALSYPIVYLFNESRPRAATVLLGGH